MCAFRSAVGRFRHLPTPPRISTVLRSLDPLLRFRTHQRNPVAVTSMLSQAISTQGGERVFDESVTTVKLKDNGDGEDQGTFTCDEEPHMLSPDLGYGYYPLTLGERLDGGKYEIVRKLGWGGYSSVWLASVSRYFCSRLISRHFQSI